MPVDLPGLSDVPVDLPGLSDVGQLALWSGHVHRCVIIVPCHVVLSDSDAGYV